MKKWTLREYIELIRFNDNIYENKVYFNAAEYMMKSLVEHSHQMQIEE